MTLLFLFHTIVYDIFPIHYCGSLVIYILFIISKLINRCIQKKSKPSLVNPKLISVFSENHGCLHIFISVLPCLLTRKQPWLLKITSLKHCLAKIEAQSRSMYDIIYWNMVKVILDSFITRNKSVDCI